MRIGLTSASPTGGFSLTAEGEPAPALELTATTTLSGHQTVFYRDTRAQASLTVQATAQDLSTLAELAPGALTFSVIAAPLATFEVLAEQTGDAVAGVPFPFRVRPTDAWGNTVAFEGTLTLQTSAPDPGRSPLTVAFGPAQTEARVEVTFTKRQPVRLRVQDAAVPPHVGESAELQVRPAPFARYLVSSPPSAVTAGAPFELTVRAVDPYGNNLDTPRQLALSADGVSAAALSPASTGSFVGAVSLSISVNQAAPTVSLSLTDGVNTVTTQAFRVDPGPLAYFELSNVGDQVVSVPFWVEVVARDAYGNELEQATSAFLSGTGLNQNQLTPSGTGSFVGRVSLQVAISKAVTGTRLAARQNQNGSPGATGQQSQTFNVVRP